jgi:hypothetical protein
VACFKVLFSICLEGVRMAIVNLSSMAGIPAEICFVYLLNTGQLVPNQLTYFHIEIVEI